MDMNWTSAPTDDGGNLDRLKELRLDIVDGSNYCFCLPTFQFTPLPPPPPRNPPPLPRTPPR